MISMVSSFPEPIPKVNAVETRAILLRLDHIERFILLYTCSDLLTFNTACLSLIGLDVLSGF